jgi:translation initiation factor 1 (eIF-1/SUI1)
MAFTVGVNHKINLANKRVHLISCSVDSASGNIATGLNVVDHVAMAPISMATAAIVMKKNVGSNATAINGTININGAVSGDVFFLTVYGR